MRNLAATLALLCAFTNIAGAQNARHPFTVDDAATLRNARAVAVSPDGKTVLYPSASADQKVRTAPNGI